MKVVALQPFVGSYPCPAGETPDWTQNEVRTNDDGTVKTVRIGYRTVKATVAVTRAATPREIEDDKARVDQGGKSWLQWNGPVASITLPGTDPFDLPDAVARDWMQRGLVEAAPNDRRPNVRPPASDPRAAA